MPKHSRTRSPRFGSTSGARRPLAAGEAPAEVRTDWLYVRDLKVDHQYQRDLSTHRVAEIVAAFDPDLLGVLLVSQRSTGTTYLLDGQTRHAALLEMGWTDQRVPCLVYTGLSRKDEARIFVGANVTAVKPSPVAIFKGKLAAGDPDTTAAYNIARSHGYLENLRNDFKSGSITSPSAIMAIYCHGSAQLLDSTLAVTAAAWPKKHVAAPTLRGVGAFIAQYGPAINMQRLVEVLARSTPEVLASRAQALNALTHSNARSGSAIVQVIVGDYNLRLKQNVRLIWTDVPTVSTWKPRSVMLVAETAVG
jgi:hypothetical protein